MKSLILKDLYGISFQLKATALLFLVPYVIIFFVGVGITGTDAIETILTFGFLNYITIVLFSSLFLNTVADDIQSGWARFQRTLPLTAGQLIGGKLLATLVLIAVLVVVSTLFNLVPVYRWRTEILELMLALPFVFGCLQVVALMPVFPIAMRFGIKTSNLLYCVFSVIAAIAAAVAAFMVGANDLPPELTRVIFYGILPLLAAGVTVLSYHLGKRALENSEG